MPSKYYNRNFNSRHVYHIFNRGAYKHKIFHEKKDYQKFIDILTYYLTFPTGNKFYYTKILKQPNKNSTVPNRRTIHLIAYCLMPNHFHFALKQTPNTKEKNNISNLMRRIIITYAMYFKSKYKHSGSLLEGKYKNVTIYSKKQLLYLSKYIHLNPKKLIKKLEHYKYSSYPFYINKAKTPEWLHPEYVLKDCKDYKKYMKTPNKLSKTKKIQSILID